MNKTRDEMAHKLFIEDSYDPGEYQGFIKGWDAALIYDKRVLKLLDAMRTACRELQLTGDSGYIDAQEAIYHFEANIKGKTRYE